MTSDQKKLLWKWLDTLNCQVRVWITEHYYPGVGLLEISAYATNQQGGTCLPLRFIDSYVIPHSPTQNLVQEAREICQAHPFIETAF